MNLYSDFPSKAHYQIIPSVFEYDKSEMSPWEEAAYKLINFPDILFNKCKKLTDKPIQYVKSDVYDDGDGYGPYFVITTRWEKEEDKYKLEFLFKITGEFIETQEVVGD